MKGSKFPTVSIVIPTYNRANYLPEALESALAQTYPNIELIVVNDGCTDNTEDVLKPYMPHIRYIERENGGCAAAKNTGLQAATGQFITNLDDDDRIHSEKVERQIEMFRQNPNLSICSTGVNFIDANGQVTEQYMPPKLDSETQVIQLLRKCLLIQPSVMIRRCVHDHLGGYKLIFSEDYDLWLRASLHYEIGVVADYLTDYRQHGDQITGPRTRPQLMEAVEQIVRGFIAETPLERIIPGLETEIHGFVIIGLVLVEQKLFDLSSAYLQRALPHAAAHLGFGLLRLHQWRFGEARKHLQQVKGEPFASKGNDALAFVARVEAMAREPRVYDDESPEVVVLRKELSQYQSAFIESLRRLATGQELRASTPEMKLKPSQFTVQVPDYPQKGKHIIYHVASRAMMGINNDAWRIFQALPNLPKEVEGRRWLESLVKHGFVVPQDHNEGEAHVQGLQTAKQNTEHLHVTLSLIQKCNFGCSLCIEDGPKTTFDGSRVSAEGYEGSIKTAEILDFLKSQCEERGVKLLHFTGYGGEPLLNRNALFEIVSTMHTYCQQRGIRWFFDLITNGALLNRKTVLELKKFGFAQVQVTINGNRETHNATRPWRHRKGSDVGTYDIIMENLQNWAGLVHTNVLCWVSQFIAEPAYELIDTLADLGLGEKRVRMRFTPISSTYDTQTVKQVSRSYAENPLLLDSEHQIIDAITKLQIYAAKRGLIDDLRPTGTWCAVLRANGQNITITPNGKIYSCSAFLGRDELYETGHIHESERGGLDSIMQGFEYPDQCKRCEYLTICSNCRADALAKTGELLGANPYKTRYQLILPQLIKAHYDLHFRGK